LKKIVALCTIFLLLFLTPFSVYGEEEENYVPDDFWEILPDSVEDLFPENFSDQKNPVNSFDSEYAWNLLSGIFQNSFSQITRLFALLLGILLFGILSETLGEHFGSGKQKMIFGWISILCTALPVYTLLYSLFSSVKDFVDQLDSFLKALSTIMATVYIMGGNTTAAVAHTGWLSVLLHLSEIFCSSLLFPIFQFCFASTILSVVFESVNFTPLADGLKNIMTTLLVFFMTVLSVILSFQTTLAAAQDNLSMRAIRFAAGNSIPIIGTMIGDSIKTLASGLKVAHTTVGGLGIVTILLLSLEPMISLFVTKAAMSVSKGVTGIFGSRLERLFDACIRMINYLMASVALFDLFFLYCLSVFMKATSAFS
jgi:stage III sporulation protein AE